MLGYVRREVPVPARREEVMEIELVPGSPMVLTAEAPRSGAPRASGPTLYALQRLPDGPLEFGHQAGEMPVPQHREHGSYRVFARGPGGDYFGERLFTVGPGRQRVEIPCVTSTWFEGTVIAAEPFAPGSLQVRVQHGAWPDELLRRWSESDVAPDGSFRVFGANLSEARVVVVREGKELAESAVRAGTRTVIDLDR